MGYFDIPVDHVHCQVSMSEWLCLCLDNKMICNAIVYDVH